MGYSTQFKGRLEFATELVASQLAYLQTILGEDNRDHPEWASHTGDEYWYHCDLALTADYTALEWSGDEKTYGMVEIVNYVLRIMRERWSDFGLRGRLDAQGEEVGDVWALTVEPGGEAQKTEYTMVGRNVTCPHCEQEFVLDGKLEEK